MGNKKEIEIELNERMIIQNLIATGIETGMRRFSRYEDKSQTLPRLKFELLDAIFDEIDSISIVKLRKNDV